MAYVANILGREIFDEEQEDWSESVTSASGSSKKRKKPSNVKAPANGGIAQFLTKSKSKQQTETKTLGLSFLGYCSNTEFKSSTQGSWIIFT